VLIKVGSIMLLLVLASIGITTYLVPNTVVYTLWSLLVSSLYYFLKSFLRRLTVILVDIMVINGKNTNKLSFH
jgi:hypothetical protein